MIQLAYQPVEKTDNLVFVFQDQDGMRWFETKEMPIIRKLKIAEIYTELYTGIRQKDISDGLEAIEKAINEKENGKMKPNIAMVSHVCRQLLSRSGYVINIDTLYKLAAVYYIREDEQSEMVDESIIEEKISILKLEKINDFFFAKSLETLFPFLNDFEGTFLEVIEASKKEVQVYEQFLKQYNNG